mgnify:FL=1
MTVFDIAWDLMKSIPMDIMNDPLVYVAPDNSHRFVRQDRDFRSWLYENGYPADDDFLQLDFMQQIQVLFHYRVQQGASKEQSFMEDNV